MKKKFTDKEINELLEKLDDMLICSHLGTIETFGTPLKALYVLLNYEIELAKFFVRRENEVLGINTEMSPSRG